MCGEPYEEMHGPHIKRWCLRGLGSLRKDSYSKQSPGWDLGERRSKLSEEGGKEGCALGSRENVCKSLVA